MRLRQAPSAVWRHAAGVLVVGLPGTEPTVIHGSAPDVWLELSSWCGESELIDRLADRFGVDPAIVQADLLPLIDELVARQLVVAEGPPSLAGAPR